MHPTSFFCKGQPPKLPSHRVFLFGVDLTRKFFRWVDDFQIQYFYSTIDFVDDQPHLVFGKPITKAKDFVSYKHHISTITKFTGLQVLAYLDKVNRRDELEEVIDELRYYDGIDMVVPICESSRDIAKKAIEYRNRVGHEGSKVLKVYDRKDYLESKGIAIPMQDSTDFQYNQIKHVGRAVEVSLNNKKKFF